MQRVVQVVVAAAVLSSAMLGGATRAEAQLPTVQQIYDKYATAVGGREAWAQVTGRTERGTADITFAGLSGSYVRYIGVSNFSVSQMKRIQPIAPISSLQPPYSLINREAEKELLPFCQQNNIGVIVYSPMQSGLLSGSMTRERIARLPENDWRKRNPEFQEPKLSRNLALVEKLREIAVLYQRTPAEAAIAWTLTNPAVTGAIVGARSPEQVDTIIGAAEFRFTDRELGEIRDFFKVHA